jgi:hypothetical protein
MSQVIDTESAKEFMAETLSKISPEELKGISMDLQIKGDYFRRLLNPESIEKIGENELRQILRHVFSTRRKADEIVKIYSAAKLKSLIIDLLHGSSELAVRFQHFYDQLDSLEPSLRFDLAGELLHFTFPEKLWLWSRWMWNPKNGTGSLPLVVTEDYDMRAASEGETYMNVGEAVAFVHHVGEAAGFQSISRNLFGTDVYLSCVYIIYVYTVLRMRMTNEFNKVMPGLEEFSRRLLGIYKMEEYAR